jgi:hypothetical protein
MSSKTILRLAALCMTLGALGVIATPALGAASDPLFVIKPEKPKEPKEQKNPPPVGYLEGPCGLAVASSGTLYVSDYYHDAIDSFNSSGGYVSQIANVDPLDGPCALAFDGTGTLYANNFHRNVANVSQGTVLALPTEEEDGLHHLPTGVVVNATNRVYVDNRTYITAFEANGSQVMEGLEPLRIGLSASSNYYGLAVSAFAGTAGQLYVPDATTNTVKVFDPAFSTTTPVSTLHGPGKGFTSLRDSAAAVDRVTGDVYVVDNLQPTYTEEPEAVIDVFNSVGVFLGVLKYKVFDGLPVGIAVDNSTEPTQGRVYVTSGNTDQAGVYAYAPNSQTNGFLPPSVGAAVHIGGSGAGAVISNTAGPAGFECTATCSNQVLSGSTLTLTATADPGSFFSGWSGACAGTGETCTVTMDEAASVSASFASAGGEAPSPRGEESAYQPPTAPPFSLTSPSARPSHKRAHKAWRHHKKRHRHRAMQHR